MTEGISLKPPAGFTPSITEFKGVLGNIYKDNVDGNYGSRDVIFMDFGELEVITATSPSLDASFQIQVNYTESDETRWEALRSSLVKFMPDEADGEIGWFIGHTFHMKWTGAPLRGQNKVTKEWETTEGDCWQVEGIEGLVNRSVDETNDELRAAVVADVIDGNNEADAVLAFHQNAAIRSMSGYSEAMTEITNGTLLISYAAEGLITADADGIWHSA